MGVIEMLMADYRFTLRQAMYEISLTAIFSLIPARGARLGDESQPTIAERASLTARAKARQYLETHYQIQPLKN